MVDIVLCNGEVLVKQAELTKVDEKEARDFVNSVGREMLLKASVRVPDLKKDCH